MADARIIVQPSVLVVETGDERREVPVYSEEGFDILSDLWLRSGWQQRVSFRVTWMGIPIIQLPEDILAMQQVIFSVKPDVIVETGTAHGGTAVFYASMLDLQGKGRVISIDIEHREQTRLAIEAHPMGTRITLVEGNSVAPEVVAGIRGMIQPGERVLVALDSNHSRAHVKQELDAYSPLVAPDSYLVAFDGVMKILADAPDGRPEWATDNPLSAIQEFLAEHPEFEVDPQASFRVTHCPQGFLRRRAPASDPT
ncbi:MAG: cephalosporin hydroxylase family protein [Armatimonadota bacterium]